MIICIRQMKLLVMKDVAADGEGGRNVYDKLNLQKCTSTLGISVVLDLVSARLDLDLWPLYTRSFTSIAMGMDIETFPVTNI
jgi:hypothetical protein